MQNEPYSLRRAAPPSSADCLATLGHPEPLIRKLLLLPSIRDHLLLLPALEEKLRGCLPLECQTLFLLQSEGFRLLSDNTARGIISCDTACSPCTGGPLKEMTKHQSSQPHTGAARFRSIRKLFTILPAGSDGIQGPHM